MKVIIVGGGITGTSLALAISSISKGNIQVALIEPNLPEQLHSSFDTRNIVLSYSTCNHFERIGVWNELKKNVTPITHIHISEYGHPGIMNIQAKDCFLPALGYVIELNDAGNYLFDQIRKRPNIKLYCPSEVRYVNRTVKRVSVKLGTGEILNGNLLVVADGSNSMIGKSSQIEWQRNSYQQCAMISNILTSEIPDGRAFERFTQYGPLAMLPISKGRSSLVWCHPLERKKHIMRWSNDQFREELQNWFGWRLGEIKDVGRRYYFPLLLSQAEKVISHRLVLIGNAAQTLHPIAAQGFNLTMRDIILLANIIGEVGNSGGDFGVYSVLRRYQVHRQKDRDCIIKLTDNLVRLFSNDHLFFSIFRNLGLITVEVLPFMRSILSRWLIKSIV